MNKLNDATLSTILISEFGRHAFDAWLSRVHFRLDENNSACEIVYSDHYIKNWIQNKYFEKICAILEVNFAITRTEFFHAKMASHNKIAQLHNHGLNAGDALKHDIQNDIVQDESNKSAISIIQYVSANMENSILKGKIIHLFGDYVCGKTEILKYASNILYQGENIMMNAMEFVNSYSQAVRNNAVSIFRERVMQNKLLIIDDLHLLSTQKGSIAEINRLISLFCDMEKIVIVSSNASIADMPQELKVGIKNISSAISIKIDLPSIAMKRKIIDKNIDAMNIKDVDANLLLGSDLNLKQIKASLISHKVGVNLSLFEVFEQNNIIDNYANKIIQCVLNATKISYDQLLKKSGSRAKYISMFILRTKTDYTIVRIAQIFRLKSHASVIKGIKKVTSDKNLLEEAKRITMCMN